MLNKRVLHLSFDMNNPNQRLAYEYLCNMGRNKVDMVTLLVRLLSDRYGPIDAQGVKYLIPVVARSGIGQGVIIPQSAEGVHIGEESKSKKEQKPRRTKPKDTSNTTGDIKKPEPTPDRTDAPSKAEGKFEDESRFEEEGSATEPMVQQGTEDDDGFPNAIGTGIWDVEKLLEAQKDMSWDDIY